MKNLTSTVPTYLSPEKHHGARCLAGRNWKTGRQHILVSLTVGGSITVQLVSSLTGHDSMASPTTSFYIQNQHILLCGKIQTWSRCH